jgi:pimeloyl-ACP methyl ester carboxylesterase
VLRGLWEHTPRAIYPQVTVPVLLLPASAGPSDPTRARKEADVAEAQQALPNARTQWFDPADHDVHAQHPTEVARALLGLVG